MLQGNRFESERGAKLAQTRPTLVARLRLFGMLAALGPLFAGLNSVVLESVPQVEVRFISAESTQPTPDVVVVERVVDRMVYVPVDNLSAPAPQAPAGVGSEPADGPPGSTAGIGETTDDTTSEAVAGETETAVSSPAVAAAVRPAVYAPPIAVDEPVADEAAEPTSEDAAPAEAVAEAAESDEPVVATTPRPIIVHTMTWNGDQFVQDAVTVIEVPAARSTAEDTEVDTAEEAEIVADDEKSDAEHEQVEPDATDEEMAVGDEPDDAVADEATDGPVQVMSADGPGQLEQIAATVVEVEVGVAAEASEQLEQAVEASNESEDVAEVSDEPEEVAVQDVSDESEEAAEVPGDDDATRARVQAPDVESTPAPTN